MPKNQLKILGVLLDLPLVKKGVSGTRNLLNSVMRDHGNLYALVDPQIYGLLRNILILKNFHPNMQTWRFKSHLDTLARRYRSLKAERIISQLPLEYDAVLQIGSEFNLNRIERLDRIPKFSYHDNNLHGYLKSAWDIPKVAKMINRALAYESQVYAGLTGIFAMTKYLRDIFIEDFHVPKEKVHYVGFGHNLLHQDDGQKEYDGKTILFIARHAFEQKGGRVLLDAFSKVKRDIPDARLLLVGQDLRIDMAGVECLGFIDKTKQDGPERLHELYRRASVFVLPSYNEAAGNVFVEAMSHKVPCIGAECCAMPEIIVDSHSGYVVPPGDSSELARKICMIMKDESLMRELGKNGFRAVQEVYNWDVVYNKVIDIIINYV